MIFIIKKMISFQVLMEELLSGRVPGVFRDHLVPAQNTASVGISNEEGMLASIKENRISGFWPYPMDGQERFSRIFRRHSKEVVERAIAMDAEPLEKTVDCPRLLSKESRRPTGSGQLAGRD